MQDKLGKVSKTGIREACFNTLKEYGFTVTDVKIGNGYFVFDLGKNSVVHFKIKEIPYWLFGLWIQKEKDNKEYTIQFFGEKEDWIDKFKPSATTISSSKHDREKIYYRVPFVVTKKNQHNYSYMDSAIHNQLDILMRLKKNRRIAEYGLSGARKSFLKWLFDEIKYYDIQKPLEHFYEKNIVGKLYKAIIFYYGIKYHKYIKPRPVIDRGDNVYPRYETGVEYIDYDSDTTENVWYSIEDLSLTQFLNKHSNFLQYIDKDDHKGFYYPEYYEKKREQEKIEREKRLTKLQSKVNKTNGN